MKRIRDCEKCGHRRVIPIEMDTWKCPKCGNWNYMNEGIKTWLEKENDNNKRFN
jgi:predicted nucleic-acid-binding Zn-ribbon protein